MNYETFGLEKSFQDIWFMHVFLRHLQYATMDKEVCRNFKCIFIKSTQAYLTKCLNWLLKYGICKQEWNKACVGFGFH